MEGIETIIDKLESLLGIGSIGPLIIILALTFFVGKGVSALLRWLSRLVRKRADASVNLSTANFLRRAETWIILSIAIAQIALMIGAVYLWWDLAVDQGNKGGALIGMSALAALLIGGVTGPLLRDLTFGASMMAEHWYGVGDLISIDSPKVKGVVEAVTLRSTKIRGINGEIYWIANSSIQGVSVARRGLIWIAVELFVNNVEQAEKLIDDTNARLPQGSTLLAEELAVSKINKRGENLWHMTAVGGVAPGREWVVEMAAVDILKKLDAKSEKPVLEAEPVHHYDDREAEQELRRAVKNARKPQQKFDYSKLGLTAIKTRVKNSQK